MTTPEPLAKLITTARARFPDLMVHRRLACWIFLRLLGLIFIIAFASLFVQVEGLIGEHGIVPASQLLDQIAQNTDGVPWLKAPTLCWISTSDAFLRGLCIVGMITGLLLSIGCWPWVSCFACWLCYLSLCTVSQQFMSFQWDILLLETAGCALFLIPLTSIRPRGLSTFRYHRIGLVLLHVLLFKLMLSSGAVKLSSKDPTWRDGTALTYHYQTQPLPIWTAWHMHHAPRNFHAFSQNLMYGIELGLPFLIFLPRLFRLVSAAGMMGLMVLIMLTGNYTFFNLLTIALCIALIDDRSFARIGRLRTILKEKKAYRASREMRNTRALIGWPLAIWIMSISALQTAGACNPAFTFKQWPKPLQQTYLSAMGYRSLSSYGLFRVMTTERPEIIIEGSDDGITWLPYAFKYKPGRLDRRPGIVAPHQPRLDWQMWFASLSYEYPRPWRSQPWMLPFVLKLLEGEPAVLELLAYNPFPDAPPRNIRAGVYRYTFTSPEEREASGDWWKRSYIMVYLPELHLNK